MGGKALPAFIPTRRYGAAELLELQRRHLPALRAFFSGHRLEPVQPLLAKESFGDLDLLLEDGPDLPPPLQPAWEAFLRPLGLPHVSVNGLVVSIPIEELQVDLIRTEPERFDFAARYYSYGDTGNLIGRVAGDANLLLGFRGLFQRDERGEAGRLLSADWEESLRWLGYDPAAHRAGLSTPEEAYAFVASSPAFRLRPFLPESRPRQAAARDARRPFYQGFLEWARSRGLPETTETAEAALDMIRLSSWLAPREGLSPRRRP